VKILNGFAMICAFCAASSVMAYTSSDTTHSDFKSDTRMEANILNAGTKGIGFSFPNGGGGTISGAYFLQKDRAVRVDFGMDLNKKDPADVTFGFSLDAGYRMYCAKVGNVAAFLQPSFFISRASAASAPVTLGPSGSIGAEYFFNNNLAFGVYTGLNLTLTDSFKSVRLNTGTTAITGTMYW
jgi:hypothetical protein